MSTDHEVEHSPTMRREPAVRDPPSSRIGNRHDDLTIKGRKIAVKRKLNDFEI